MASYKILKQVEGLEDVLNMARREAKRRFSKRSTEELKEIHFQRLGSICDTLEKLGIVDNAESLLDDLLDEAWDESWGESQKCNS